MFTLPQYDQLIVRANRRGHICIHEVRTSDILSSKDCWPQSYNKNFEFDEKLGRGTQMEHKISFKILTCKHFQADKTGKVENKAFVNGYSKFKIVFQKDYAPSRTAASAGSAN